MTDTAMELFFEGLEEKSTGDTSFPTIQDGIQMLAPEELKTCSPFSELFPISPALLQMIGQSMRMDGYLLAQPITAWIQREQVLPEPDYPGDEVIWREERTYTVIDGHTRLEAAKRAGIERIPVSIVEFDDEADALAHAIACQRNRRSLTDADLLRCVQALDERRSRGGDRKSNTQDCVIAPPSSHQTAELLGISPRKVEQVRTVLDHGDEETREAVLSGEKSINRAYVDTTEKKRETPQTPRAAITYEPQEHLAHAGVVPLIARSDVPTEAGFNRTNDNIEWARWSWNPVTGCLHDCDYCYARDIAVRFYPQGFVPTYYPERLSAPARMKLPAAAETDIGERNVFVCSMADLFGKWVPAEWIDAVLEVVRAAPQWNFLFLTKFPQRLPDFEWPANAWVGTTVDRQYRVQIAEKAFARLTAGVKWLSCEPMLEKLEFGSLSMFDWVVIGGASKSTKTDEWRPPFRWTADMVRQADAAGCQVYMKTNLGIENGVRLREYPGQPASSSASA